MAGVTSAQRCHRASAHRALATLNGDNFTAERSAVKRKIALCKYNLKFNSISGSITYNYAY
jgi:hypothetical protein